ncbi:EAL domain-containing protein [Conexibacter sp. JD483]|uniref:putative bifunctional diguanylate cyclase/phosphodiesterase n=1 Tax=unclassified Conexibacter TaxID=2627773 RepID=UPI0027197A43|nr:MULTISPECIES: EAL domain-containing protein [unclassified Conexibacter]MDO8187192.1 EAL domain-containing protein [Conexibacter sp. CPCC 205706]MDO8199289.1 EAL domain-containing protein [Conexibacter sp. CPCC 205762]MDR9369310.1 EAL domain-containing protein [Conexibacter sp. JD483]
MTGVVLAFALVPMSSVGQDLPRWLRTIVFLAAACAIGAAVRWLVNYLRAGQHALAHAQQQFRTAFEDAPIGIALFDVDGRFTEVNRALCEMVGSDRERLVGLGVLDHVAPADRPESLAAFRELMVGARQTFHTESRLRRADGREIWCQLRASLVRDAAGEPLHFIAQVEDVSARRRAAEALAEAEERFRLAFEGAPIGIALADLDGRFLRVNDALCEITGYTEAELLAANVDLLGHSDAADAEEEQFDQLMRGELRSYRLERRIIHATGRSVWVSLSVSLVRDSSGVPRYCIKQLEDISDRKRFEGQLAYLADHDALTGLYNRRAFQRELEQRSAAGGDGGAVVVLDLDHFKDINDTLGHAAGDEVIVRVARLLAKRLRKTDVLGRLGGDEFAMLLAGVSRQEAERVIHELLRVVREQSVVSDNGHPIGLTASAGIALFDGDTPLSAEELLVSADIAMYDAKEAGRDRHAISVETEQRQQAMTDRMAWSQRMRDALEHDSFVLFQQPVVDLQTGLPKSHELLLRMRSDAGDLIPPAAFLPIAERSGLITEIDRWVTHQAITTIAEQRLAGRSLKLAVNLSGASVSDPELLEMIERDLEAMAPPRGSLIFEVTETAAIVNVDRARAFAATLAELGCELALDDFGAGFGSFYYLKRLPFDYLKIDGDFIRQLTSSHEDQLVVRAIVEIARGLGKRTVAEFVGDVETMALLRELGVDDAQGFHIGRPAPLTELFAHDLRAHGLRAPAIQA